jgi:hypothetical protein
MHEDGNEPPRAVPGVELDRNAERRSAVPGAPLHDNRTRGQLDHRELLCNDRAIGPAPQIAVPVDQVASLHAFMIDIDLSILNRDTLGDAALSSTDDFHETHLARWLCRDPVLTKAEVRDSGHGVHVLLWLDEPIVCVAGMQGAWDAVARGLRNALPGDPNLNGITAMTRPVGAVNTKSDPPRIVRVLRPGQPVSKADIIDLSRRIADHPARFWMQVLHGRDRIAPCPFCRKSNSSLGIAGNWQIHCYDCSRHDAQELVYRLYSPTFLGEGSNVDG